MLTICRERDIVVCWRHVELTWRVVHFIIFSFYLTLIKI